MKVSTQGGFSAIELLITLFIATIFLTAGHLLYSSVIRDSSAVRQRSQASNLAYQYLQAYSATAPQPCRATTPLSNSPVPVPPVSIANVRVTVQITCPVPALTDLAHIRVALQYGGNPTQEVVHAIYATR